MGTIFGHTKLTSCSWSVHTYINGCLLMWFTWCFWISVSYCHGFWYVTVSLNPCYGWWWAQKWEKPITEKEDKEDLTYYSLHILPDIAIWWPSECTLTMRILFTLLLLFCDTRLHQVTNNHTQIIHELGIWPWSFFWGVGQLSRVWMLAKLSRLWFSASYTTKATRLLKWISPVCWNKLICDPRVLKVVTCR